LQIRETEFSAIDMKRKMTPKKKRILFVSGGVAALLIVVITALVLFINVNVYKPQIEAGGIGAFLRF
jgi:hypothetical protein